MKRIFLAGAMAAVALGTTAVAQPYGPYGAGMLSPGAGQAPFRGYAPRPPVVRGMQVENPAEVLRKGLDGLIAFLDQKPAPDRLKIAGYLESEITPLFDFVYMARVAAGPAIRDMSDDQRARLEGKLKELFLGALAEHLMEYDGQRVTYLPPRRGRGDKATLSVSIENPSHYPAELDFRLRRSSDGWRVVDVAANGNSALAYYRSYFRRVASAAPMGSGPRGGVYR